MPKQSNVYELDFEYDGVLEWPEFKKILTKQVSKANVSNKKEKQQFEEKIETVEPISIRKKVKKEDVPDYIAIKAPIIFTSGSISVTLINMLKANGYEIDEVGGYFIIKNADLFGIKRNTLEYQQAKINRYGIEVSDKKCEKLPYWSWGKKEESSMINYCYNNGLVPDNMAIHGYADKRTGQFSHGYAGYMWALLVPVECKLNSMTDKELGSLDFIIVTDEPRHNDEYGREQKFDDPLGTKKEETAAEVVTKFIDKKKSKNEDFDDDEDEKEPEDIEFTEPLDDEDEEDEKPVKKEKTKKEQVKDFEDEDEDEEDEKPVKKEKSKKVVDDFDDDEADEDKPVKESKKVDVEIEKTTKKQKKKDIDTEDDDEKPVKKASKKDTAEGSESKPSKKLMKIYELYDDEEIEDSEVFQKVNKFLAETDEPTKADWSFIEDKFGHISLVKKMIAGVSVQSPYKSEDVEDIPFEPDTIKGKKVEKSSTKDDEEEEEKPKEKKAKKSYDFDDEEDDDDIKPSKSSKNNKITDPDEDEDYESDDSDELPSKSGNGKKKGTTAGGSTRKKVSDDDYEDDEDSDRVGKNNSKNELKSKKTSYDFDDDDFDDEDEEEEKPKSKKEKVKYNWDDDDDDEEPVKKSSKKSYDFDDEDEDEDEEDEEDEKPVKKSAKKKVEEDFDDDDDWDDDDDDE